VDKNDNRDGRDDVFATARGSLISRSELGKAGHSSIS